MVGSWQWSVLLGCLSTDIWQASASISRNQTGDQILSVNSKTLPPDTVSIAALSDSITVDGAIPKDFNPNFPVLNSGIWPNVTSSGRRLRQIDQILQQNYWLVGCNAKAPNEAAARLKQLITQIRLNIKIVIREAQKGVASQFGFREFFKTNDNIPRVIEIFQHIANGDKLQHLKANQRSSWMMSGKKRPIVGCAFTANDQLNSDAYLGCQNNKRYAFQPLGSAWVYLCPSFWNTPKAPSTLQCPKIGDNGSLSEPSDLELHMNQEAIFVHEMVHMYLGLSWRSEILERYTLGAVIELGGEEAVENASNYGYFYSAVIAACLRWPYGGIGTGIDDGGL